MKTIIELLCAACIFIMSFVVLNLAFYTYQIGDIGWCVLFGIVFVAAIGFSVMNLVDIYRRVKK